jgi:hypothetical protein
MISNSRLDTWNDAQPKSVCQGLSNKFLWNISDNIWLNKRIHWHKRLLYNDRNIYWMLSVNFCNIKLFVSRLHQLQKTTCNIRYKRIKCFRETQASCFPCKYNQNKVTIAFLNGCIQIFKMRDFGIETQDAWLSKNKKNEN